MSFLPLIPIGIFEDRSESGFEVMVKIRNEWWFLRIRVVG